MIYLILSVLLLVFSLIMSYESKLKNVYGTDIILMGMDAIILHIATKGYHASPFLVKKWIRTKSIPVRYELDRYFSTTYAIDKWVRKNRKHIEKL